MKLNVETSGIIPVWRNCYQISLAGTRWRWTDSEHDLVRVITPPHPCEGVPHLGSPSQQPARLGSALRDGFLQSLIRKRRYANGPRDLGRELKRLHVKEVLVEDAKETMLGERLGEDVVHSGLIV